MGGAVALAAPALAPFAPALTPWLDAHRAEAVLVRPDRYVFGTSQRDELRATQHAATGLRAVEPTN